MTEREKAELAEQMSDVMQKFAVEYVQPQFDALHKDLDTKYTDLKQDIADLRTALKDMRQE